MMCGNRGGAVDRASLTAGAAHGPGAQSWLVFCWGLLMVSACGDTTSSPGTDAVDAGPQPSGTQPDASASPPPAPTPMPLYVVGSGVRTAETVSGYARVLPSLELAGDRVDLDEAVEFPGPADMWAFGGSVYAADGFTPQITRYEVGEDQRLEERETLSFGNFGLNSTAFWNVLFISPDKAYMRNGVSEYIVWNPSTMEISGTVDFPDVETKAPLVARAGLGDRGALVHEGKVFQPIYWTDHDYADRADTSIILVFDAQSDTLLASLDVDCGSLDYVTVDDEGTLYFSNWTGAVGSHFVLDTHASCAVRLDPDELTVDKAFEFSELTDGREGAALHYVGNEQFVFSTFHAERIDLESAVDPFAVIAGENWRIWVYDRSLGSTRELTDIGWNSGAVYWFNIDGAAHALVPALNYAESDAYRMDAETGIASRLFGIQGWCIRLFRLR